MKLTNLSLLALSASLASARFVEQHEKDQVILNSIAANDELYLIETAPGKRQMVTEEEKWELRRVCILICNTDRLWLISRRMDRTLWTSQKLRTSEPSRLHR